MPFSFRAGLISQCPNLSNDLSYAPKFSDQRNFSTRSQGVENWENEGGNLAAASSDTSKSDISAGEIASLATEVALLDSKLASDFANGRVGTRLNSYQHRARVLRQQKAQLQSLQAKFKAQQQLHQAPPLH